MSTLAQIEHAVADLPPQDQRFLLSWLQKRLAANPAPAVPDAVRVFRKLQAEAGLTPDKAAAWKQAVADARR